MNLVFSPVPHESYVTQWLIEYPTGVHKVQFLSGTQISSASHARDMLITSLLISSTSLKSTIFLYLFEGRRIEYGGGRNGLKNGRRRKKSEQKCREKGENEILW